MMPDMLFIINPNGEIDSDGYFYFVLVKWAVADATELHFRMFHSFLLGGKM